MATVELKLAKLTALTTRLAQSATPDGELQLASN